MEVIKVRLQSQTSQKGNLAHAPKYRNTVHALCTIIREEGVSALYRGASLTALRQATNVSGVSAFLLRDPRLDLLKRTVVSLQTN